MSGITTLHVRSINHRLAPTAIRERAHMDNAISLALMEAMLADPDCISVIPVSTCNRTEVYWEVNEDCNPDEILRSALKQTHGDPEIFFCEQSMSRDGLPAIEHLFRVASGLESMVLGEPQIAGQLKDAYRFARKHHEPGPGLLRAFQGAFRAGKRVRTLTRISTGAISVAFAAVELSRKFFADLSQQQAVLVGAGETGSLAARHFLQHNINQLVVVNRSFDKAASLAETLIAEQKDPGSKNKFADPRVLARPWDELTDALAGADVILTTTGSLEPVITAEMVHKAVAQRKGKPLFLLDIAVPRDVAPDVASIGSVFVFGLDDLDNMVQANKDARDQQIPHAEKIVADEIEEFKGWLADVDLRPTVAEFRAYLEDLKDKQVGFVRKKQSNEVATEVDRSLQQFIKKVLGRSVSSIKQSDSPEERERDIKALGRIFHSDNQDQA